MRLVEVGPRDGLQNAPRSVEPALRAELIARLATTGLEWIEATSFVDPRRVPQMAGAEELIAVLERIEGVTYMGLVLNERGFERLLAAGLGAVRFTFAVSDAFNRRNSNTSTSAGVRSAARVIARANEVGMHAGVVLGTAFGCPFAGEVRTAETLTIAEAMADAGADEVVFADTIGVAVPRQVTELLDNAVGLGPTIGVHLHNTRNTGYANALAAIEAGSELLDSAIGGLGGCPFAPGASGNIATEDVVYMLEREGVDTGVDLDALIRTAEWLRTAAGLRGEGQLQHAGPFPAVSPAGVGGGVLGDG